LLLLKESTPILLTDGNGALYPLAKDCNDNIRDPLWLDLPPLSSLCVRISNLPSGIPSSKSKTALMAFAVQHQRLMPYILRCDLDRVKGVLTALEEDCSKFVTDPPIGSA
jgi:E3 ubiquitin-protein ligase EDD1